MGHFKVFLDALLFLLFEQIWFAHSKSGTLDKNFQEKMSNEYV